MTIETEVAALTASTTALTTAVGVQQTGVDAAVLAFETTTTTVDNLVADADKPVSTLQAEAIALKQTALISGTTIATLNGDSLLTGGNIVIDRSPTELAASTYDARNDLRSLADLVAGDIIVVEGIGLMQFLTTQAEPDDDETCFNVTTGGQWLLATPSYDLISAYNLDEDDIRNNLDEDESERINQILINLGVI